VICARFADSTKAYQGYGGGLPLGELDRLEVAATGGLRPDRTILLDVPVEIGLARKAPDDRTRFETGFDVSFHQRVRNGFLALAVAEPGRFVVLDARADPDDVARRVLRAVEPLLEGDAPGEPKQPDARIHR
jgi:dTMP kinase